MTRGFFIGLTLTAAVVVTASIGLGLSNDAALTLGVLSGAVLPTFGAMVGGWADDERADRRLRTARSFASTASASRTTDHHQREAARALAEQAGIPYIQAVSVLRGGQPSYQR